MGIIEFILDFIAYVIIKILFGIIIKGFFRIAQKIGVYLIWALSFNDRPLSYFSKKYKHSSTPYVIGFGLIGLVVFVLIDRF